MGKLTTIKDHGEWQMYEPERPHLIMMFSVIYAKRKKDGKDWYEYVREGNFEEDTVKLTCKYQQVNAEGHKEWIVMVAARDVTKLFPGEMMVLELEHNSKDPQEFFVRKVYDPNTEEFSKEKMA